MKKFEGVMLSAIIITLIVSSTQAVIAADKYTVDPDLNLRYEVYLQSVVRDAQGQLLSVSESTVGWIVITSFPDGVQIPDLVDVLIDNNVLAEKKVVTIDNIKYEKIQYREKYSLDSSQRLMFFITAVLEVSYGPETVIVDANIFQAFVPLVYLAEDDEINTQWTIFRKLN